QASSIRAAAVMNGNYWVSLVDQDRDSVLLFFEFCLNAARGTIARTEVAQELDMTRKSIATLLLRAGARLNQPLHAPPDELASVILALCSGYDLQQLVEPQSISPDVFISTLARFVERI
ncbi:TetR family transcriptional regulator C-terminal domain-containing protein, partial [Mycobacteroides chelonae]